MPTTNNAANMSTVGIQALGSSGVINGVTIGGTANQIAVANGDGSANPTLSFPSIVTFTSTQPLVLAYLSATTAAVTGNNTNYTVIFDTETNDQGPNYNNATGVFTAPVLGNYMISGMVAFSGLGTTTNFTAYISSTPYALFCGSNALLNAGASGYVWCPFSGILRLSAGNTLSITANGTGGTLTNTIVGGVGANSERISWISINLIN